MTDAQAFKMAVVCGTIGVWALVALLVFVFSPRKWHEVDTQHGDVFAYPVSILWPLAALIGAVMLACRGAVALRNRWWDRRDGRKLRKALREAPAPEPTAKQREAVAYRYNPPGQHRHAVVLRPAVAAEAAYAQALVPPGAVLLESFVHVHPPELMFDGGKVHRIEQCTVWRSRREKEQPMNPNGQHVLAAIDSRMMHEQDRPAEGTYPNLGWQVFPGWLVGWLEYQGLKRTADVRVTLERHTLKLVFEQVQ